MFRYSLQALLLSSCFILVLGCLPTEFTCESGQCIDGSRFCDGTTDCADGTDEHHGCTNCNRTYYGLSGVKYSLRLNEPAKQAGSVCTLSFIAAGGIYGDLVEVTFLSFHIGVFHLESFMCYHGYMEIEDSKMYPSRKRSPRYLRRSRKKGSANRKDSPKSRQDRQSPVGSFCGKMTGESAIFYSTGDKVNLNVFVSPHVSDNTAAPRLYLTYRFLRRNTADLPSRPELGHEQSSKSSCDRTFTECHTQICKLRSPNYPGFYLRNLTCFYRVRQIVAPPGLVAQVEVYQDNEFKINVLRGLTNNDRYKPGVLTSDCAGDVIRVYDGRTTLASLLAEFCGSGPLPTIRSSGPDMLVELRSVPYQALASSKFELKVRIHFVPISAFRITSNQCAMNVDASRTRSGILSIPGHSIPANTTCSFRVSGKRPSDRIWLYFVVFSIPDFHPWSEREHCDVAKLRIAYPKLKFRHRHQHHHQYKYYQKQDSLSANSSKTLVGTFCEKTSPKQCGHAFDFADYVPSRACSVATESYLSSGPELLVELEFLKATAVHGTTPHFVARYELIDVDQPMTDDACVVRVRSSSGTTGWLENPKNLFLYGRGGQSDLSCLYELRGDEFERIRITVNKVKFASAGCVTTQQPTTGKYRCAFSSFGAKSAVINVTEVWKKLRLPVGCLCSGHVDSRKPDDPVVFETVSNEVNLHFRVSNMGPRDDFRTFHFEIKYEFVSSSGCVGNDYVMTGVAGQVSLDVQHRTLCRWLLVSLPSRSLYITVKGKTLDSSCQNKYIFYELHKEEPFAVYCASEDEAFESLYTSSWSQADREDAGDTGVTVLETVAERPGHFSVHWVEVTRRSRNSGQVKHSPVCELECPELEACISGKLACDGTVHCPRTAEDESPERCDQLPLLTIAFCSAIAVVASLLLCLIAAVVRHRLQRRGKTPVPAHVPPPPAGKECSMMATMTTRVRQPTPSHIIQ